MTIAIVSTLARTPVQTMPADEKTSATTTGDASTTQADFATLLNGLPGVAAAAAETTPGSGEAAITEASPAAGDPVLLAAFGQPLPNPPGQPPAALGGVGGASRARGAEPLTAAASDTSAAHLREQPLATAEERPLPVAARVLAAASTANIAASDFAAAAAPGIAAEAAAPTLPTVHAGLPGSALANAVNDAATGNEAPRHLPTALGDPSWANELGQKLLWFASNDRQLAQLTLHPAQLGTLEITLNLSKDGATAHFVSPSAEVREAIETAVPRLREMLASSGIELGQVSVGGEFSWQQAESRREPSQPSRRLADNAILGVDSADGLPARPILTQRGYGMIDVFA
jgi:flagellar hook-length control protein FliK